MVFWAGVVGPGTNKLSLARSRFTLGTRTIALRAQKLDLWASLAQSLPFHLPGVWKQWKIASRQHVRESGFRNPINFCFWNPESGKILLVESGILDSGIRNTAQVIRNPIIDWNSKTKSHWQGMNPVPGIRNPWRGIQNPRMSWIPLQGGKKGTPYSLP